MNGRRAAENAERAALAARAEEERRLEAEALVRRAALGTAAASAVVRESPAEVVALAPRRRRSWAYRASVFAAAILLAGWQYWSPGTASREQEIIVAPAAARPAARSSGSLKFTYTLSSVGVDEKSSFASGPITSVNAGTVQARAPAVR
jgi:hypothetical protein